MQGFIFSWIYLPPLSIIIPPPPLKLGMLAQSDKTFFRVFTWRTKTCWLLIFHFFGYVFFWFLGFSGFWKKLKIHCLLTSFLFFFKIYFRFQGKCTNINAHAVLLISYCLSLMCLTTFFLVKLPLSSQVFPVEYDHHGILFNFLNLTKLNILYWTSA